MRYIVYIDRLLFLQLMQALVLFFLTGIFLQKRVPSAADVFFRLLPGAGLQALLFCGIFLMPGIGGGVKNLLLALASLILLVFVFRIRGPGLFLRAVIFFHGTAFLLGGILFALRRGKEGIRTLPASACVCLTALTVHQVWKWEKEKRERVTVEAWVCDGEESIPVRALIDSGNSLYDPVSRKPVSVVERSLLEGKISLDRPERFRLIPYHTLGGRGLMQAVEVKALKVKREGQELVTEGALLGLFDGKVAENGGYQMILHPALLKSGGDRHDIKSGNTGKNAV